jgi:hypothetical protein
MQWLEGLADPPILRQMRESSAQITKRPGRRALGQHLAELAQLMVKEQGQVHFITLRRLLREELVQESRRLGLVALDAQSGELIRP